MPKIPEISVGSRMKRSICQFLPTGISGITFDRIGPTDKDGSLPCFSYVGDSEKELKVVRVQFLLVRKFEENVVPFSSGIHIVKHPTCTKYHIRALCPFLDFLVGIF